ncbi:MAG: hypothetical protein RLZZ24_1143 [Pseudomonadota bacterium]
MHRAPSVSYPVGRGAFERRVWLCQLVASALLWAAWVAAQSIHLVTIGTAVFLIALSVWGYRAMQTPQTILHWNELGWSLQATQELSARRVDVGEVKPVLDLQSVLLLHWQPLSSSLGQRGAWLCVSQSSAPEQWLDLRRAVYGPRR